MFGTSHRRLLAVTIALVMLAVAIEQPVAASTMTYVVRPHDTLSGIATTFGTTVSALEAANGLRDGDYIVPGQVLVIPIQSYNSNTAASTWPCRHATQSYPAGYGHDHRGHGARWHDTDCRVPRGWNGSAATTTPVPTQAGAVPTVTPVATSITSTTAATEAATVMPTTVATEVATSGSVAALLTTQAQAAGVDPALVKAVAWQESGWRMVTAADGGIGIMQLMPDTVTWVETTLLRQTINPYVATDNVRAGVAVLRYYLNVFGNERLAIAAYHQGMHSVQTQGVSAATAQYVASVLSLKQRFA